jgi:hypothetical protein
MHSVFYGKSGVTVDDELYIPIWWHSGEFFEEHIWVFSYYWDIFYGLGFHVEDHYVWPVSSGVAGHLYSVCVG